MAKPDESVESISRPFGPPGGATIAPEEAESTDPGAGHKTTPLQFTLSFKCRLQIMKPSNNKLLHKRAHVGAHVGATPEQRHRYLI